MFGEIGTGGEENDKRKCSLVHAGGLCKRKPGIVYTKPATMYRVGLHIEKICSRNLMPTDCLNMKTGSKDVLDEFTSHFVNVSKPNTVGADETYKCKVLDHLSTTDKSVDCVPLIDVSLILDKMCLLKSRKAGGHDGIQNENVMYAGPDLAVHLCLLFNAMLLCLCS